MIRYKLGIMQRLKQAGYPSTRIRRENIFGEKTGQQLRTGAEMPNKTINTLCRLLDCQPGDLLEYVPDDAPPIQQEPGQRSKKTK